MASLEVVFPRYSVNLDKAPATPKQLLDVTLAWPLPRHSVTSRLIATLFGTRTTAVAPAMATVSKCAPLAPLKAGRALTRHSLNSNQIMPTAAAGIILTGATPTSRIMVDTI